MGSKLLYLILSISFSVTSVAYSADMYSYHQDKRKEAERRNMNKIVGDKFMKELRISMDEVDKEFPVNALRDCIIFTTSFVPKEHQTEDKKDNKITENLPANLLRTNKK